MGLEIVDGKGSFGAGNVGHSVVTNGILCMRGSDAALPKLRRDFLFTDASTPC